MSHYIYSKEGVQQALELNTINEVTRYKKRALAAGRTPSKIVGGIEMFDIDILLQKNTKVANNALYSKEQLEIFATGRLFKV